MPYLRDAHTSEAIFEGTPEELALLANELGRDEVLFDGVGLAFDPDAVLSARQENIDANKKLAASTAKAITADIKDAAKAAVAAATEQEDNVKAAAPDAQTLLDEARARREAG
jgi:hypothetical protein